MICFDDLCIADFDSHHHLFFECGYAAQVWNKVSSGTMMVNVPNRWIDITSFLEVHANSKTPNHIVNRLVLAATSYFIWQERNNRLFRNQTRPPDVLSLEICDNVRLKLLSINFKLTSSTQVLLKHWKIDQFQISDDGG